MAAVVVSCLVGNMVLGQGKPERAKEKGPSIRLHRPEGAKATFDVLGLEAAELAQLAKAKLEPGQWAALFAVYVENETKAERPAVLGTYRIDNDVIHFEPQFPLTPGLRYKAVLDLSRLPGRAAGKP